MSQYGVFETFQDAVIVINGEGKLVEGNLAATLLLDVSARRLVSRKEIAQFVTFEPDPINGFGPLTAVQQATQMREVGFTTSTGKQGSVQVVVQPQPSFFKTDAAEEDRWIVSLRDVSLEKILANKYKGELDQKEAVIEQLKAAREKLEEYSRDLEKIVAQRTAELQTKNALLKTILDSLGQGILVFDKSGICLPIYSQVCQTMFGVSPEAKPVGEVLSLGSGETETFAQWREAVFAQMLDFEDLIPLAPSRLNSKPPTEIALNYSPLSNNGAIDGVVLIATDRTKEVEALKAAQKEKELVRRIVQVAKHREAFKMFALDAAALLGELQQKKNLSLEELKRRMHTVKGGAATFGLAELAEGCHELENELEIKVPSVEVLAEKGNALRAFLDKDVAEISELLALGGSTSDSGDSFALQDVLKVHLGSLSEIAKRLGKKAPKITFTENDVRLSREFHSALVNSFVHAFRNSIDHGIESPEERVAAGKPEQGNIAVTAVMEDAKISIVIADDGKGVDTLRLRKKLQEKKHPKADAPDEEIVQTLLEGDLSTKDGVTDISGRGIGVSAVAAEIAKLGGAIRLVSRAGHGMRVEMSIPAEPQAAAGKAA